jgi:hypothetical protein
MFMQIRLDLTTVPPGVSLEDPDDFKGFKLVVERVEHAHVGVDEIKRLAGEARAGDAAWLEQLEGMLAYARSKGWVDESGAVRAHVEWS